MITEPQPVSAMVATIIETTRQPLKEIAEDIGVTTMTLYRWKKGLSVPKSQAMIKALESYANRG